MQDKHIFFDLDHTLWDFEKNSKTALKEVFKNTLSEQIESFASFHGVYKNANKLLWQQYSRGSVSKETLRTKRFNDTLKYFRINDPELAEQLAQSYLDVSPYQKNLLPGTMDMLDSISKEGFQLHIITNGFKEVQHIKMREAGLTPFFDVIVCSEEVGYTKPDTRVFEHAMALASADKRNSLMIGDNYQADYLGGLRAGMKSLFFNHKGEHKVRRDDDFIEHLREIPEKLPWIFRP